MKERLEQMNLPQLLEELKAVALEPADDPYDDLRVLATAGALAEFLADWIIPQTVRMCRELGHTWEEIGASLGISRSQAWQRYHPQGGESQELTLLRLERDRRVAEAKADAVRRGEPAEELKRIETEITQELLRTESARLLGGAT